MFALQSHSPNVQAALSFAVGASPIEAPAPPAPAPTRRRRKPMRDRANLSNAERDMVESRANNSTWQGAPGSRGIEPAPAPAVPTKRESGPVTRRGKSWNPPIGARRTMATALEVWLRTKNLPYISVDEAKRALFAGAKLKSFHFVVYRSTGKNWLVWAARACPKVDQVDLEQWGKIFGDGFEVARAFEVEGGFIFRNLDRKELTL